MKRFFPMLALPVVGVLAQSPVAADEGRYARPDPAAEIDAVSVRFLPPEVVKRLEITPLRPSEPIPLIVGTYWQCRNETIGGPLFEETVERCRLKLVTCVDDQSFCVEN
ncbi:MAG: hypothetical protein AAFV49_20585 [Pseudomonadota bacterium]